MLPKNAVAGPNKTRDRAVEVVTARYGKTRGSKPVTGAEVYWDWDFRLSVALYGAEDRLLAVYRISQTEGILRVQTRPQREPKPFTLDNRIILAQINEIEARGGGPMSIETAATEGAS